MDNDSLEDYREEAISKRKSQNLMISESAENYVRALLSLSDPRVNGHGIDALDISFSPPIRYEIKTALRDVKILDTQFHYQKGAGRFYFIMVRREDKVDKFNLEDSLLFNFGDIYILPIEVIREHYIIRMANRLAKKDEKLIENGIYKNFGNLLTSKRRQFRKEIEKTIEIIRNGESISHDERNRVAITFEQLRQIATGCGPNYWTLKKTGVFKDVCVWKSLDGPYIHISKKDISKVFIRDIDDIVISDLEERVNRDKIRKLNEIKRGRLALYKEIKEKEKDWGWSLEDDPDRMDKLNALKMWQNPDLFTNLEGKLPF